MPNNFRHQAIMDLIIAQPQMTKGEIAAALGYTQAWLSTLISSDAFQLELGIRRARFSDELDAAAVERLHDLDKAAGAIIAKELAKANCDPNYALSVKKTVQTNMKGSSKSNPTNFTQNIIAAQNNTQINQSVLARARNKMMRINEQVDDSDDLVGEVLAPA